MSTKRIYDATHAYVGCHRRTVERAYDSIQRLVQLPRIGKHRRPDDFT